jgi:hypothetical protein
MPATPVFGTVGLAFCGWVLMLAGIASLQARVVRGKYRVQTPHLAP